MRCSSSNLPWYIEIKVPYIQGIKVYGIPISYYIYINIDTTYRWYIWSIMKLQNIQNHSTWSGLLLLLAMDSETPEEELLDLLTCHRSVSGLNRSHNGYIYNMKHPSSLLMSISVISFWKNISFFTCTIDWGCWGPLPMGLHLSACCNETTSHWRCQGCTFEGCCNPHESKNLLLPQTYSWQGVYLGRIHPSQLDGHASHQRYASGSGCHGLHWLQAAPTKIYFRANFRGCPSLLHWDFGGAFPQTWSNDIQNWFHTQLCFPMVQPSVWLCGRCGQIQQHVCLAYVRRAIYSIYAGSCLDREVW